MEPNYPFTYRTQPEKSMHGSFLGPFEGPAACLRPSLGPIRSVAECLFTRIYNILGVIIHIIRNNMMTLCITWYNIY